MDLGIFDWRWWHRGRLPTATSNITSSHYGHICIGNLTIIGSNNGLSPGRRQAIIWTNGGILLIGPLGTYFSEILIRIQTFSFKKMYFEILSAKSSNKSGDWNHKDEHFLWNCPQMNATGSNCWWSNVASGKNLLLSDNKQLLEWMLT